MTTAPSRAERNAERRSRRLLLSTVVGVVLVVGSVTETAWLSRSLGAWPLGVRLGLVLAATAGGAVLAWTLRARLARPHAAAAAGARQAPGLRQDPAPGQDDGLVRRVLEVRDLLDNAALRARLDEGLRSVGFDVIAPVPGEPFDAAVHAAVDTELATDSATPGTVAAVEQVGLWRGGTLVRRASVVVWGEPR